MLRAVFRSERRVDPADYYSGTGTISTIDIKNAQLILTDDAGEQHAIDLPQG